MFDRLKTLMYRLTHDTVLADLLAPVSRALARVRQAAVGRTLTLPDFIALGVLRQLQGIPTLREQVQSCRIWTPRPPRGGPWHAPPGPMHWRPPADRPPWRG
jgi:hypothetical protein